MTTTGICRNHFFHSFIVLVLLALGCAKSIPPPGGPVDKIPPELISTTPPTGATRISLDSRIVIDFSEAIDKNTAARAIFISPQLDPEPKIKIKSKSIIITPREPLKPDRTYVITLGTDLKDAHRVNLAQSVSLAFSTGITIDSGSISGTIFQDGKRTAGISLALFENDPEPAGLPVDSLVPDYITQSGENGAFSFSYLPYGQYYLVAFSDKNKNRRIDPGREQIGLPYDYAVIDSAGRAVKGIDIQLHMQEAGILKLLTASVNPDRLIKIRFNEKLDESEAMILFEDASITSGNDSTLSVSILDFTNLSPFPSSDYLIYAEPMPPELTYRLQLDISRLYPLVDDSLKIQTADFSYTETGDIAPPMLLESTPGDKAVNIEPDAALYFRFSEPIDSTLLPGGIWITDSAETMAVSITAGDYFTFNGVLSERLDYGKSYTMIIDGRKIVDRAGNRLSDSSKAFTFTTIGKDTLGQLSGEVLFTDPSDAVYPVVVTAVPVQEGDMKELILPPGQSRFTADLLPGYYTITAFLDRNDNGEFDFGSIIPYRLAERFCAPADTFRVRARFESAGVDLEL